MVRPLRFLAALSCNSMRWPSRPSASSKTCRDATLPVRSDEVRTLTLPIQSIAFRTRLSGWLIATIVGLALVTDGRLVCAAETLSIGDFVGHFRGEAQVQAGDRFFIQQLRDAQVEIRPEPDGFRLSWTTVIHYDKTDTSKLRQRTAEVRFVAGPKPNQFRSLDLLEPFTERPAAWAYIDRNTLVVHVLSILADGNYELQTYERALSGKTMILHFSRVFPGKPELVISGRLMRQPE